MNWFEDNNKHESIITPTVKQFVIRKPKKSVWYYLNNWFAFIASVIFFGIFVCISIYLFGDEFRIKDKKWETIEYSNNSIKDSIEEEDNNIKKSHTSNVHEYSDVIIINGLVFKKYHFIDVDSVINNKYTLYSGLRYYENIDDTFGNIEFQIVFEGTKEECESKKKEHDSILNQKIKEWQNKINE